MNNIEQLRQWLDEYRAEHNANPTYQEWIDKFNELQPVKPDVEGYLDNARLVFVDDAEQGNVEVIGAIFREDALAALQALAADKDAEKEWMAKGFREQDKIWNELVANLTAENERLKEQLRLANIDNVNAEAENERLKWNIKQRGA